MKRIGLTQRVVFFPDAGERRDCLDQNWARLMRVLGWAPIPLSNEVTNVSEYVQTLNLDGVLLTGGNDLASVEHAGDVAPERDRFEQELLDVCTKRVLPVLGVCRGAQFLGTYHGASINRVEQHVGRHKLSMEQSRVTQDCTHLVVNSYHNFGIRRGALGPILRAFGHADDGTIEAFEHPTLPQFGIMWHPERDAPFSEFDLSLLRTVYQGA